MQANEENAGILAVGKTYGALNRNISIESPSSVLSPRRVIYCVHGRPSAGCCTVLEGELININPDNDDITTHAKENTDTTELGKQFIISKSFIYSSNKYRLPTVKNYA
ncbi:hypothetical protein NQ314_016281 [Rhamnusium bicolor]|uniref:Uncharacterized protein n=1 Tax=Rhamnusium bicolor TaxID=1586634 RepID=A0AAV8WX61_9CUCU|nr:hypothetical protein NQ314_016281 [Rhamnusium bicolor]